MTSLPIMSCTILRRISSRSLDTKYFLSCFFFTKNSLQTPTHSLEIPLQWFFTISYTVFLFQSSFKTSSHTCALFFFFHTRWFEFSKHRQHYNRYVIIIYLPTNSRFYFSQGSRGKSVINFITLFHFFFFFSNDYFFFCPSHDPSLRFWIPSEINYFLPL